MVTILILGALFTGVGIYTMENKRDIDYSQVEVMRCQQQGEDTVCYQEKK